MDLRFHRPTSLEMQEALAHLADTPLSYDRSTLGQDRRFHHHQWKIELADGCGAGAGDVASVWRAGRHALETWQGHRRAGVTVRPEPAPLALGQVVVLSVAVAPLVWTMAGCRLVEVEDDEHRFGFSYGTLEGHPESGEERFTLVRTGSEGVIFEIEAWSRPAAVLARLAGPVEGQLQQRITRRYLEGVRQAVGFT